MTGGSGHSTDDRQERVARGVARCEIWGVLNVTPDSFSDGGLHEEPGRAVRRARQMLAEGADVLDVGGESSRPAGAAYGKGADPVPEAEELRRVLPVVELLTKELGARVSVDTVKAEVARRAIGLGAAIINDVSGGQSPDLLRIVAESDAELVLMHNCRSDEADAARATYVDVAQEVSEELMAAVTRARCAGIDAGRIWIDPGIGFAKGPADSLELVARTAELVATGYRVLVGPSRKSFIAALVPDADGSPPAPLERVGGTAVAVASAVRGGASAVRVHDVAAMRQAVRLSEALVAREQRP